jgi:uncharacterized protein (TIGR02118 family)
MSLTKLIVAYPYPPDVQAFEKVYAEEHVPLAVAKLAGKTKMVATKIMASPQGSLYFIELPKCIFLP